VEVARAADADRLCRAGTDDLLGAAEALPDMAALAAGLRASAGAARAGLAAAGGAWLECLDDAAALASATSAVEGAAREVAVGRAAAGAAVGADRAAREGRLCRALALAGAAREGVAASPALAPLAPVVLAAASAAAADAQRQAYAAVNAWLGAARTDAPAAGEVALARVAAVRAAGRSLTAARRRAHHPCPPAPLPPGLAPLYSPGLDAATAPVAAALLADAGLLQRAAAAGGAAATAPLARAARALAAASPAGATDLRAYFFRSRRLQLAAEASVPPPGFPRAGIARAHASRVAGLFAAGDDAAAAVPVLSGAGVAVVAAAAAAAADDALPWPGGGGANTQNGTTGLIGGVALAAAAAAADAADDGWDDVAAALEAAVSAAAGEVGVAGATTAAAAPPSPSNTPPPTAADLLAMKDAVLLLADAASAGGRPADGLRSALAAAAPAHAAALIPAAAAAARRALGPPSNGARAVAEIADAADATALGGGGDVGGLGLPLATPPSTTPPRRFPAAAPFSDAAPALARLARAAARDAAAYGAGLGLDPGDALRSARSARDAVSAHALAPALLAPLSLLRASFPGALEAALQAAADAGALAVGGASLDAYTVACVVDGGTPLMPPSAPPEPASGEVEGTAAASTFDPLPAALTSARPPLCPAGSAAAAAPWTAARRSSEVTALALVAEAVAAALARTASLPWLPPVPVVVAVAAGSTAPAAAPASLHVAATQGVLARAAKAAARALPPARAASFTAAAVRSAGDAWVNLMAGDAVPAFNAHALGRVSADVSALVAAVDALQARHGGDGGGGGGAWADGLAAPAQLCHALLTPGGLADLGDREVRASRFGALDLATLPALLLKYRDVTGGGGGSDEGGGGFPGSSASPGSSPSRLAGLLRGRRPASGVAVGARRADVVAIVRRMQEELEEEEARAAAAEEEEQ
jgi:hypothetical protein